MPTSDKLDAVVAAPKSHKVLFENEKIRILEVIIESGEKEPEHVHKFPSIMIITHPAKIRYYNEDGSWFDIEPDQKTKTRQMEPEPLHSVENIDNKLYKAIRVEFKQ